MTERILSISGLRGVVGNGLEPDYVVQFAAALGTMTGGGTIVLARDGRSTGPMVKHAVLAGLLASGCRVFDAGIASTPTCGVLVDHLRADGGLQITASHNPAQWNGLKPFSSAGGIFNAEQGGRLMKLLDTGGVEYVGFDRLGTVELIDDPSAVHLERVLKLVDVDAIRGRRFQVVLDCNRGSGGVLGRRLLAELGCEVDLLGGQPDGQFEHTPEPIAENLDGLCAAVRQRGADVGFAQDPDADRLAIVDDNGRYIGEELTLALCADHRLARDKGPLVVNGSTSRVNADIAAKHGCDFHRTHVGEAHVVAAMRSVGAVLGGEGNGGVIEPRVGFVRDSFVSMAYVLDGLTSRGGTLSGWTDTLPAYFIVKDKLTCPRERVEAACEALTAAFPDAAPTAGDGLRLDWDDRWVQVRASNTEPIIRVIAETTSLETATRLCREAVERVADAVQ